LSAILSDLLSLDSIISIIGVLLTYLLGGVDDLLVVFIVVLILGIITKILNAILKKEKKFKELGTTIIKKCGYILAIILVVQLDKVTGNTGVLRTSIIIFFIGSESLAVIQGLSFLGVSFPKEILDEVKKLISNQIDTSTTTKELESNDKEESIKKKED